MQLMFTESDKHSNISIAEIETTKSTKTEKGYYCSRKLGGKTNAAKRLENRCQQKEIKWPN